MKDHSVPEPLIIAIDGPAGAGKTTAARGLSKRLGIRYLDTGATFRAIALKALRTGISLDEGVELAELARHTELALGGLEDPGILMDGEDVSAEIRTDRVSRASSRVAGHAELRTVLVALWRKLAAVEGAILEGRDIGTVVFPDADVKFFLDASPSARAGRRFAERDGPKEPTPDSHQNVGPSLSQIAADLAARDEADTTRKHAPLRRAEDALVVDTTDLKAEAVLDRLEAEVRRQYEGST